MNMLCQRVIAVIFFLILFLQLSGCGETVHGVKKDAHRMGRGIRTIFIRDSE